MANAKDTCSEKSPVIDLVHLARQSLGDRGLECELLALFERQAGQIIDRLTKRGSEDARKMRTDLAHTLKGSALAVGANRVAEAAADFEAATAADCADLQMKALRIAVEEARRTVSLLLVA